jgi:hypothetical protein
MKRWLSGADSHVPREHSGSLGGCRNEDRQQGALDLYMGRLRDRLAREVILQAVTRALLSWEWTSTIRRCSRIWVPPPMGKGEGLFWLLAGLACGLAGIWGLTWLLNHGGCQGY